MIAEVMRRLRQRTGDLREALAGEGDAVRDALGQAFPDGVTARMDGSRWILEGSGSVTSGRATGNPKQWGRVLYSYIGTTAGPMRLACMTSRQTITAS